MMKNLLFKGILTITMLAIVTVNLTAQSTIYVDASATGSNNGTSWADAYTSLQSALDNAVSGDQIWAAKGTYKPSSDYGSGGGSRYYHFRIIKNVSIYGGFAGTETAVSQRTNFGDGEINQTILSGDVGTIGDNTDNCYHIIYNPIQTPNIDATAVLDGFTIKQGYADGSNVNEAGGGILNQMSSPTLRNLIVESNYANNGGGIYYENSTAYLSNVVFKNNSTAQAGAGLFCLSSSGNINNITFSKNNAGMDGGAIFMEESSILGINNGILWGNTSAGNGNEIFIHSSSIYLNYSCYSNSSGDIYNYGGTVNQLHCISVDPVFVDETTNDFRTISTSPCVNAGNNDYNSVSIDVRGKTRIQNTTIDMGTYEWTLGTDPRGIIYVDDNASGLNTGYSWTDAYISLQSALEVAVSSDQIWAAKGTYKPSSDYGSGGGSRYYHFEMKNGVAIYGGFAGTESAISQRTDFGCGGTNETILSGDIGTVGVSTDNCLHIIKNTGIDGTALLDGFTIMNGYANANSVDGIGGGILNVTSSPALQNLIVELNYANTGGGIYYSNGTATVCNVVFKNNSSAQAGAAIVCAASTGNLNNVTFSNNNAGLDGGAIFIVSSSTLNINNGILWGNTASGTGNEICIQSATLNLNNSCYSNGTYDVHNSGGTFNPSNCISTDPVFADDANDDFRILGNSPCVNTGEDTYNSLLIDVRGEIRIQNSSIDMGAYEWTFGTDPLGTYYVNYNATGSNTGHSWADAFTSLQSSLDIAVPGDQIWVVKGTYYPSSDYGSGGGSRYYHFEMKNEVAIYGGFAGMETSINERINFGVGEANETILSGDIGSTGDYSDNCYHVVYNPTGLNLTNAAILNGFTISDGNANGSYPYDRGGGILTTFGSSPEISMVSYISNRAVYGAGLYIYSASPIVNNCLFYSNTATLNGGAVGMRTNSNPVFTNITIVSNIAANQGGGLDIYENSQPVFNNCIIWGNAAAIGAQFYASGASTVRLNYTNYSNSANDVITGSSPFIATNNDITSDPEFIDPSSFDYRIRGFSPCRENGSNAYNSVLTDIRGQDRIQNTTIDMGAYEWTTGIDPLLNDENIQYVNVNATGSNNGSSWADAYISLQSALDFAPTESQIWVAKGTYNPSYDYGLGGGTRYYHFRLKEGVEIFGGFSGTETDICERTNYGAGEANETILSGDLNGNDNFDVTNGGYQTTTGDDNCYHVFYHPDGMNLTSSAILDGFTISGGNATDPAGNPHYRAGGFYAFSSSPTIQNVVFKSNSSNHFGGAVYIYNSSSDFTNVSFINNKSFSNGGGIYVRDGSPTFNQIYCDKNYSANGGAMYVYTANPNIINAIFTNNNSSSDGGAFSTHSSSLIITNALLSSNTATNNGGAIIFYSSSTQYNTTLNNVTISDNQCGNSGGAIRFASNNASSGLNMNNNIIWDNTATTSGNEFSLVSAGTTTLNYSCYKNLSNDIEVLNGTFSATNNNITTNPGFVDSDDFRITGWAACKNNGLNTYNTLQTDIRGQARIQNTTIDMGAYEWTQGTDPMGLIYVDINATGTNSGKSWTDAFTSLQTAFDAALSGDTIWVAKGTYKPSSAYNLTNTPRFYHFRMKEGVGVYGGFAGTETSINERTNFGVGGANETILSGDIGEVGDYSDNCYHVMYNPADLNLTTTAILNSFTISDGNANGPDPHNRGGGIMTESSPEVSLVSFISNRAVYGGGLYTYSASPIVNNCLFYSNTATSNGGAVGISTNANPVFTNTTIASNIAEDMAGGLDIFSNSQPVFNNCIVWGNTAPYGKQFIVSISTVTMNYSTYSNASNDVNLSYGSDFIATNNNITSDPEFIDPGSFNFRISGFSLCKDNGLNTYNALSTDIRGQIRIQNTTIDMGAYEWTEGIDPINPENVVYVNGNAAGANNGSNWTDAFNSLQAALDIAISESQIWVAGGTYMPSSAYDLTNTSRYFHFRLIEGVEIYGGFAGTETDISQRVNYGQGEENETILSGDIGASGDNSDNCYHVLYHPEGLSLTSTSVLDGFTIEGGNANHSSNPHNRGGGIYLHTSSPTLSDITLSSNNASNRGGGAYFYASGSSLSDIRFISNTSSASYGGGAYFSTCTPNMDHVDLISNTATNGGGLYINTCSSVNMENITFADNNATNGGGLSTHSTNVSISNGLFKGNTCTNNGAAINLYSSTTEYNASLSNVTISNNQAGGSGGGIRFASDNATSTLTINNGIVWGNTASTSGNELSLLSAGSTLLNYSCYKNQTNDIELLNGTFTSTNNNITTDPGFVDGTSGDFRILGISSCKDSGQNSYNTLQYDIREESRIQNTTIDMGAYEWTGGIDPLNIENMVYVDGNAAGANNGSNWTDAFNSLQGALDIVLTGGQIWVAKGTYNPSYDYGLGGGSRYYYFRLIEGVEIYGGFAGTESDISQRTNYGIGEANETILSGDLNGDDVVSGSGETLTLSNYTENCYHVIYNPNSLSSSSVLNGFTVKGGNANGVEPFDKGPGILNSTASPTLTNITFTANTGKYGGGIFNYNSSPTITNCLIYGNKTTDNSAGIENSTYSSPILINTTIAMNITTYYGGGMLNYNHCSPTLKNCIVWGNIATTGNQIYMMGRGTTTLNYSCYSNSANDVVTDYVWDVFTATNNNITDDPFFVNVSTGDFSLFGNSPAVSTGLNSYNDLSTDIRGENRIQNTTIDMGAYEWTSGTDPQGIFYVDVNAVGANNGTSWTDAFSSLQSALDAALSGDQIWVAKGTYKPRYAYDLTNTPRCYHYRMVEGVEIYGGFTGTETSVDERVNFGVGETNETILSGDLNGDDLVSGSGETLTFSNNSENCYHVIYNPDALTSLSVLNGFTIKGGNCNGSNPHNRGGGIFNSGASPSLENLTLLNNGGFYGGGIYCLDGSPCITNCLIYANTTQNGAGIENKQSSPTYTNTTITMNLASDYGGGMNNYLNSSPTFNNCIIWENSATSGDQIYISGNGTVTLNHSCYSNNEGDVVTASGSDIFVASNNNITVEPIFVNSANGDFRIFGNSIAVNNGGNSYNTLTTDIRGQARIQNSTIDMGAYEWTSALDPGCNVFSWTGALSNDWNTPGNWSGNMVPTSTCALVIPDVGNDDPIVNQNPDNPAICQNLTIQSGAVLNIAAGKALNVLASLNNEAGNSGLVMKSTADGTGTLINSTAEVPGTLERYMAAATWTDWEDGWHFVSSPVADYPIENNFTVTPADEYDFYAWSFIDELWINFKTGNSPSFVNVNGSSNFELGRGYMTAYKNTDIKNFTGEINVGDVQVANLMPESWNLLGNPFTSALTWDSGDDWQKVDINGTAQIWNEEGKSYSAILSGEVIPATNGFMVKVGSTGGSLTIPSSKRVHNAQAFYKNSGFPVVKLKAHNLDSPSFQESILMFNPGSTADYEMEFDCDFLPGYAPQFYSQCSGHNLCVNSLPEVNKELSIPFSFAKNEGENFSIEMYEEEGLLMDLWLLDKKTGDRQCLSESPIYVFTSYEGDDLERFKIQFGVVGIEEQNNSTSNIQLWAVNKCIHILNPDREKGTLRVINIYGQVLVESQLNGNESQELYLNVSTGNYIVSILGRQQATSKKVFVK